VCACVCVCVCVWLCVRERQCVCVCVCVCVHVSYALPPVVVAHVTQLHLRQLPRKVSVPLVRLHVPQ